MRKQMNQCLAYLYPTAEEAVAACQANHPDFVINEVTIDDTKPEVVKVQSSDLMITSKAQMLKVIATTAAPHSLTREEKFQVFVNVCDNMLAEGRITKANHTRWTHIF